MAWAELVATREPRPHLLGLELEPFPYPSAFSLVLRVTRLMALDPCEWFRTLGVRYSAGGFSLPDLRRGCVSRARLEAALGLTTTSATTLWAAEAWSPLRTAGLLDRQEQPIRWCPQCARFGYHCAVFQLPSIDRCPWHGSALLAACPRCRKPSVGLIDSLGQLGRCDCGFDSLEMNQATVGMWTFPTSKAETWIDAYLAWATQQRERRVLVAPESSSRWREGFALLAQPPAALQPFGASPSLPGARLEEFAHDEEGKSLAGDFWGWGALGDQRPLTFVPLPASTLSVIADITTRVLDELPTTAEARLEIATGSDPDARAALTQTVAGRPACFIAPHTCGQDGSAWLNVSAVDLGTLQTCGQLIDRVIEKCDPDAAVGDLSRQAARTAALGRLSGHGQLSQALERILALGYAQGLDALLRASLGLPPPSRWHLPVVEFDGEPRRLRGIRVCWVEEPVPRLCRPAQLPPRVPPPKSKPTSKRARRLVRQPVARRKVVSRRPK